MKYLFLILSVLISNIVSGAIILIDEVVNCDGLICFPTLNQPNDYYYLPASAELVTDDNGVPQFSFLRYKISESELAGGMLTAGMTYSTSLNQLQNSIEVLKEKTGNNNAHLAGPVTILNSKFYIISSILGSSNNILGEGQGSSFQDQSNLISVELDENKSTLFSESLNSETPNLSFAFELSYEGVTNEVSAKITIDWSKISKSEEFGTEAKLFFIEADVKKGLKELINNGSIVVDFVGSDENIEQLTNRIIDRLIVNLFTPVETNNIENKERDLVDRIGDKTKSLFNFKIGAEYRKKEWKSSGAYSINLSGRNSRKRTYLMTANIGDNTSQLIHLRNAVVTKSLSNEIGSDLQISVVLDNNLIDNNELINSVELLVYNSNDADNLLITDFSETLYPEKIKIINSIDMASSSKEYNSTLKWNLSGGSIYEEENSYKNTSTIFLSSPFKSSILYFDFMDKEFIKNNFKAIFIEVTNSLGLQAQKIFFRTSNINNEVLEFEGNYLRNFEGYNYTITCVKNDGTKQLIENKLISEYTVINIDENE